MTDKKPSFFIVWNPDGLRPPKQRHDELYKAQAEASRLAIENSPQEFFVMEAKLVARVRKPVEIEEFSSDEIPF
ncbi:hypothetical protein [Novosphingobium sp. PY1]|uniref:Uncharacterized protein n=1 Tax=Ochrobactrum sp. PW1 TaxID=1882222 RepID=A0A292GT93_9HYPH|nr:hypothetical protein [Novosphingobium sp. PY1]BBA74382.1 hypothetical protein [Ochrobactrum sp. PW1]GFM29231.1 uncharacterized protein PY1_contig-07-157 [Novosphingobium sp. PY1]